MFQSDSLLYKLVRFAGSRVFLNLLFWIFLFAIKAADREVSGSYSAFFYLLIQAFLLLFFISISYINNLILLPGLFFTRRRILYFLSIPVFVFPFALVYTFLVKWIPLALPGFDVMKTSIVMSPVSNDLSFSGTIDNMQTYYVAMLIWVMVFSLFGIYRFSSARIKDMQEALNTHRETELYFLKNQINPHFLFNTLNNLYALTLKKSDHAPSALLKLSSILRYMLYDSDALLIDFEREKEIMQAYIDIELLRLADSPDMNFYISTDRNYQVPPLIWLPLLENVFKHSRLVKFLYLDYRFTIYQNVLTIYCKNNFEMASDKESGGIGLVNLRKRLQLLYPDKHTIQTFTEADFYSIELTIQLQ